MKTMIYHLTNKNNAKWDKNNHGNSVSEKVVNHVQGLQYLNHNIELDDV